jgi:hypothetical protein
MFARFSRRLVVVLGGLLGARPPAWLDTVVVLLELWFSSSVCSVFRRRKNSLRRNDLNIFNAGMDDPLCPMAGQGFVNIR